jgi:hypothetical protein
MKPQPGMTEREHHAWGALLKYVETIAIACRYDRYPKSSKTGKKIDRFLKASRELREQLNWECGWVTAANSVGPGKPGFWDAIRKAQASDVYHGDELRRLQWFVTNALDGGPPARALRCLGTPVEEYQLEARAQFQHVVKEAIVATQSLPRKSFDWLLAPPPAVPAVPKANPRADLRAALLENPDQPQAAFVRRFRVHPITVRRCRRELEEAGVIPVLAHRHGPSLAPAVT